MAVLGTGSDTCDVLVVGGGPVGLLLGALLAARGMDVRVVERRERTSVSSRAIGVHPPGLACLARVGVAEALIAAGVKVRCGRALLQGEPLAAIDFSSLCPPFDFVLSVPQSTTERLLRERLKQLAPYALTCGVQAEAYRPNAESVSVTLRSRGAHHTLRARFVVGCDGRRSGVRQAMGAPYRGQAYAEHFMMSDLPDHTPFGSEAVVFVGSSGLVESFPLPDSRRRWVVSAGACAPESSGDCFARLVHARTGLALARERAEISTFVAERYCASSFVAGRLLLAGDAAHVVSPIGGQGMNLGWLDACALAEALPECLAHPRRAARLLASYARTRRRAAQRAARRAELYMALGFSAPLPLRALALRALGRAPVARSAARFFTMQGL